MSKKGKYTETTERNATYYERRIKICQFCEGEYIPKNNTKFCDHPGCVQQRILLREQQNKND